MDPGFVVSNNTDNINNNININNNNIIITITLVTKRKSGRKGSKEGSG
jgi:hypothetical protein